jgi:hypothetical protein
MTRLVELVVTAAMLTIPAAASAQTLTEAQARAAIAPWYQLFNQPVQGDMKTLPEPILTADYDSCWGYLPGECWGRETSIKVVGGFAKSIPDMKVEIKEILAAGDRVVVRELSDHGHRHSNRSRRQDRSDVPSGKLAQCLAAAARQVAGYSSHCGML